jgi:CBS domain-containing protein
MRRDTFSVFPDTSIEDVIHFIETSDIQCVAVVNTNREFMGLIFDRDLLTVFSEHRVSIWEYLAGKISFRERGPRHRAFVKKLREKTAAELIKKDLPTVLEETSIDEAIELMTEKALKDLPVLDAHGKFKGLISRESLLRAAFKNS